MRIIATWISQAGDERNGHDSKNIRRARRHESDARAIGKRLLLGGRSGFGGGGRSAGLGGRSSGFGVASGGECDAPTAAGQGIR